jgi:hypothetical protein
MKCRKFFIHSALMSLPLLLASFAFAQQAGEEPKTRPNRAPSEAGQPSREELIRKLEKTLTGAQFDGQFTVEGKKEQVVPGGDEKYTIVSARKLPEGDLWLLKARIKYGKTDSVVPLPIEIQWAGDTPVITMTRFTIPEMGTFSARVVIYEGRYAGTWQHDSVGGHLFGAIRAATDKEKSEAEKAETAKPAGSK